MSIERQKTKAELIKELEALRLENAELREAVARPTPAAEAWRKSESRLRAVFDNTPIFLVVADTAGHLVYANRYTVHSLGYPLEELLGLGITDIIHEEDREAVQDAFQRALRGEIADYRLEERFVRKDGSYFWGLLTGTSICNEAGETVLIAGYVADITEHRRMEWAHRDAEGRFRALFMNAPVCLLEEDFSAVLDWFATLRADGVDALEDYLGEHPEAVRLAASMVRITDANEATRRLFEADSREEILGLLGDHMEDGFDACFVNELQALWDGRIQINTSFHGKTRKGAPIDYVVIWTALTSEGRPDFSRVIVAILDISQQQRMENALRASQERYQHLLESINGVIWEIDLNTMKATYVSPKIKEILGFTWEECQALAHEPKNGLFPDGPETVLEAMKQACEKGRSSEIDYRMRTADGRIVWIRNHISQIDCTQTPPLAHGIMTDVTDRKYIEDALLESEAQYRSLFETMSQGVLYRSATGELITANPAAVEFFGLTKTELCEHASLDPKWISIHEDGSAFSPNEIPGIAALETGQPVRHVVIGMYNPREQRHHWALASAFPQFRPGEDAPYQAFTVFTDITKLKQTEDALHESRRKLETLLANLPGLAYRCRIDTEWTMEFVSEGCRALTGYEVSDLLGNHTVAYNDIIHPDDREFVRNETLRAVQAQEPFLLMYRIRTAQGEIKQVFERGIAVGDVPNRPDALEGFISDISERMQAEEDRLQREKEAHQFSELLKALLDVGNTLTRAASMDDLCRQAVELGRERLGFDRLAIWFWNPRSQRLSGSYGTDAYGQTRDERMCWIAADGNGVLQNQDGKTLRSPGPTSIIEHLRSHTVYRYPFSTDLHLIEDGGGLAKPCYAGLWNGEDIIGLLAMDNALSGEPITKNNLQILALFASTIGHLCARKQIEEERENLEAQVRHAQKLESLGVLAGGIAHDFNNLLMAVLGYSDLALQDIPAGSAIRPYLEEIEKGAKRGAELSTSMLAYSGKGAVSKDWLDLNALIIEMGHLLEHSVSKKARLHYRLASTLPQILADPSQIRQVVMNLIINASEAIGEAEGFINIATGAMPCKPEDLASIYATDPLPAGMYAYLDVSDTGCGMAKEAQDRLFDPFYTTKFTGRGLGLSAVLGIVRGHGGAIHLRSAVGAGTTFRIYFPASQPARINTWEHLTAQETPWRCEGLVLLVDDDETVRNIGKRMLERTGLTVLTAADGIEAIQIFREHAREIRCVILDLSMPRMDGEETLHALMTIHPGVPVIMSSGYGEEEIFQRLKGRHVAEIINKPYTSDMLYQKIRMLLEPESFQGIPPHSFTE